LIKNYWEERSDKPFTGTDEDTPETEWERQQQRMLASYVTEGRVLKVDAWNEGGRKGVFNVELLKNVDFTCIDVSRKTCAKAHRKHGWINVACADMRRLPFRNSVFDMVLDISSSDHLPFSDFPSVVEGYKKVLKQSGKLLLVHNKKNGVAVAAYHVANVFKRLRKQPIRPRHYRFDYDFEASKVENTLKKDFEILETKPYGNPIIKHFRKLLAGLGWRMFYKSQLLFAQKKSEPA